MSNPNDQLVMDVAKIIDPNAFYDIRIIGTDEEIESQKALMVQWRRDLEAKASEVIAQVRINATPEIVAEIISPLFKEKPEHLGYYFEDGLARYKEWRGQMLAKAQEAIALVRDRSAQAAE